MKVFCIGLPKTGTTSMKRLAETLGMRVAPQGIGETLFLGRGYDIPKHLLKAYIDGYDFFQDVPFNVARYHAWIAATYPGSRFVLTVRRDFETWYSSVLRFYASVCGVRSVATAADLARRPYRGSTLHRLVQLVFGPAAAGDPVFDRERFERFYEEYNSARQALPTLTVDVSDASSLARTLAFMGHAGAPVAAFPHENRTRLAALAPGAARAPARR